MRITPEIKAQFDANRLRMTNVNSSLKKYFWAMLVIGAAMFAMSFFAGALSTIGENRGHNAGIFYRAMSSGVFQILFGILSIVFGWMTTAKKRIPCIALLVLYSCFAVGILVQKNGTFNSGNLIFLGAGILLNAWAMHLLNEDAELREQPGYPHFVPEAAFRAEYEESADVVARRAAAQDHMESLGTPAMPFPPTEHDSYLKPEPQLYQPLVPEPVFGSAPKPLGPTPSIRLPEEVNVSGPIKLEDFSAASVKTAPEQCANAEIPENITLEQLDALIAAQKAAALPQVDASEVLADMAALPSHATVQGHPEMLPSPEEVRARMAAMKRAREEHLS